MILKFTFYKKELGTRLYKSTERFIIAFLSIFHKESYVLTFIVKIVITLHIKIIV